MLAHFILYVRDQERVCAFYEALLGFAPRLHVPGMTEFALGATAVLGLMPEQGIARFPGRAVLEQPTLREPDHRPARSTRNGRSLGRTLRARSSPTR